METNNSYLKHQMKILSQHEGVTVEAREKAYTYVEKYMTELIAKNAGLEQVMAQYNNTFDEQMRTIQNQEDTIADLRKDLAALNKKISAQETKKAPVKKKTQAKKTVSK